MLVKPLFYVSNEENKVAVWKVTDINASVSILFTLIRYLLSV